MGDRFSCDGAWSHFHSQDDDAMTPEQFADALARLNAAKERAWTTQGGVASADLAIYAAIMARLDEIEALVRHKNKKGR